MVKVVCGVGCARFSASTFRCITFICSKNDCCAEGAWTRLRVLATIGISGSHTFSLRYFYCVDNCAEVYLRQDWRLPRYRHDWAHGLVQKGRDCGCLFTECLISCMPDLGLLLRCQLRLNACLSSKGGRKWLPLGCRKWTPPGRVMPGGKGLGAGIVDRWYTPVLR
jgi:hypothetical protein